MSLLLLQKRREMMKQFAWNTVTGIGRVVLENGLNAKLKALNLKGKTEQEKTYGRNLIDMYRVVDNEGYVDSDFKRAVEINKFHVEEGKQYVLITKGRTNNFGSYSSVYFGEANLKYTIPDTHVLDMNVGAKTIDENKEIKMVVTAKKTCDITHCMVHGNAVVEKAYYVEEFGLFEYKDGSEEYEQYTGNKPSPSPDYPQEIVSAGRKSKNLFDIDEFLTLTPVPVSGYGNARILTLTLKPNTPYTLSTDNEGTITGAADSNRSLYLTTKDDTNIIGTGTVVFKGTPKTKTTDENGKIKIALFERENALPIMNKEKYVMLNEGSKLLPYEHYSNKYMIDVKLTGKNLWNPTSEYYVQGTYRGWHIDTEAEYITLSIRNKDESVDVSGLRLGISGSGVGSDKGVGWVSLNAAGNSVNKLTLKNKYVSIYPPSDSNLQKLLDRFYIQVEEGRAATEYEPYKEQLVTLTADRPLTKWDRIIKKDGVWGVAYKHRTIDDFATLAKDNEVIYGNPGDRYFSVSVNDAVFDYDYNKIYCEVGTYVEDVQTLYVPKVMQKSFLICVKDEDTIATAKEHLHYKAIYETEEAEFVQLTEAEQIMMNNLHTEKGTTYITANSGEVQTEIEATYKSNRRKNE